MSAQPADEKASTSVVQSTPSPTDEKAAPQSVLQSVPSSSANDSKEEVKDPFLVDYDGPDDPTNPLNWSKKHKWAIVIVLSTVSLISNMATVMCIPAAPEILADFNSDSSLALTFLVSIWEIGEGLGPIITAPLSEIIGRMPVYNAANALFVIMSIACAVSSNLGMLMAWRFINGFADIAPALNSSIVGDLFIPEERGFAMSIMGFPPLLGPVCGPIIGGYLTQALGWRWAFWLGAITGGVFAIAFAAVFRETYKPRILRRKAALLRKTTGNPAYHCAYEFDSAASPLTIMRRALLRPAQLLIQSPVVFLCALYVSVVVGILFLLLTTVTSVVEDVYGFSQGAAGLAYLGLSIGMVFGVLTCAFTLDRLLKTYRARHGVSNPESRLPPMILGAVGIPCGLLLYGWTAQYRVQYVVPLIGTGTAGFAFYVTTIPLGAYLVDSYKIYAASAVAATVVTRCLAGALLPLAGPALYRNLGLGWGNSVLALVAALFIPLPIVLMKVGERLRERFKIHIVD